MGLCCLLSDGLRVLPSVRSDLDPVYLSAILRWWNLAQIFRKPQDCTGLAPNLAQILWCVVDWIDCRLAILTVVWYPFILPSRIGPRNRICHLKIIRSLTYLSSIFDPLYAGLGAPLSHSLCPTATSKLTVGSTGSPHLFPHLLVAWPPQQVRVRCAPTRIGRSQPDPKSTLSSRLASTSTLKCRRRNVTAETRGAGSRAGRSRRVVSGRARWTDARRAQRRCSDPSSRRCLDTGHRPHSGRWPVAPRAEHRRLQPGNGRSAAWPTEPPTYQNSIVSSAQKKSGESGFVEHVECATGVDPRDPRVGVCVDLPGTVRWRV